MTKPSFRGRPGSGALHPVDLARNAVLARSVATTIIQRNGKAAPAGPVVTTPSPPAGPSGAFTVNTPLFLNNGAVDIFRADSGQDGALAAGDWTTFTAKEPGLGNPAADGYVLSSTMAGIRSWIAAGSGGIAEVTALPSPDATTRAKLLQLETPTGVDYQASVMALSPIHYWKLDDAIGSGVYSDSVGGIDLTVAGSPIFHQPPAATTPSGSHSVNNNGGGATTTAFGDWLTPGSGVTMIIWFKPVNTSGHYHLMGMRPAPSDGGNGAELLQLSGTHDIYNNSINLMTLDHPTDWNMLALTFDGTNMRAYCNGVLKSTNGFVGVPGTPYSSGDARSRYFSIGCTSDNGFNAQGYLDEAAFFPTALSGTDIANLYAIATTDVTLKDDRLYDGVLQADSSYALRRIPLIRGDLADHPDIDISGAVDGQVLYYDQGANALKTKTVSGSGVIPSTPADSDVLAFISTVTTGGGSLSDVEQGALQDLVSGLKSDSTWSLIYNLWPACGDFTASKYVLKYRSGTDAAQVTLSTLGSGNYDRQLGYSSVTSGGYIDSGIDIPSMTRLDMHVGGYFGSRNGSVCYPSYGATGDSDRFYFAIDSGGLGNWGFGSYFNNGGTSGGSTSQKYLPEDIRGSFSVFGQSGTGSTDMFGFSAGQSLSPIRWASLTGDRHFQNTGTIHYIGGGGNSNIGLGIAGTSLTYAQFVSIWKRVRAYLLTLGRTMG